jgi:hypothetical protein
MSAAAASIANTKSSRSAKRSADGEAAKPPASSQDVDASSEDVAEAARVAKRMRKDRKRRETLQLLQLAQRQEKNLNADDEQRTATTATTTISKSHSSSAADTAASGINDEESREEELQGDSENDETRDTEDVLEQLALGDEQADRSVVNDKSKNKHRKGDQGKKDNEADETKKLMALVASVAAQAAREACCGEGFSNVTRRSAQVRILALYSSNDVRTFLSTLLTYAQRTTLESAKTLKTDCADQTG